MARLPLTYGQQRRPHLPGEIVRGIEPTTEADPAALLLQLLLLFGNCVGHNPHVRVEETPHFANEILVLVGPTGSGRKGTSFDRILHCFPDSSWHSHRIRSRLSSGEGLLWCVRDPSQRPAKQGRKQPEVDPGELDKRLLIQEPEFAGVLRMNERQGNTVSAILRQLWEGKEVIHTLTKNDPTQASKAHVSVIGHITAEDLHRYLSVNDMTNGFANRFLYVTTRRSKLLPEGARLDPNITALYCENLVNTMQFASGVGRLHRDVQATALWEEVYPLLTADHAGLVGQFSARAAPHVLRFFDAVRASRSVVRHQC